MNTISQELAQRLIAFEAALDPSDGLVGATTRAGDKLRAPLAKLVGTVGFRALLTRAVAMAKAEVPSLDAVHVLTDGSLGGIGRIGDDGASTLILAQMLGLLMIFIGEPLTLRLVGDAWPDVLVPEIGAGSGDAS